MALATSPLSERKRVKVYELKDNDWFDRGTGFCAAQTISEEGRIYVESEEVEGHSLLEVQVKKSDNYQKQQDTLIVWTDPEGIDMALSFQEAEGCGIVYSTIMDLQQTLSDGPDDGPPPPMALPPAELACLPEIEQMIRGIVGSHMQQQRDTLAKMVVSENYIAHLIPIFEVAEDLEALPELHRLCNIMKSLVLLNDTSVIEYIVKDDIINGVVGALEYDPDFPNHKANHRQYLSDTSKYKEVVRIDDEEIRTKIHYTYRLQYLKDVVLARILDDPTFTVLNSLIYFHQVDIVTHIQANTSFLAELFSIINSPQLPAQKKKDAVLFIQQACAIAKTLPVQTRIQLFNNFNNCGLFPTVTFAMQQPDSAVRVAGTDILVAVIDHDASMMRNYIIKSINEKTKPMTDALIDLLLVETDLGVKAQIAEAIKVLLDPNAGGTPREGPLAGGQDTGFLAKMRNPTNVTVTDNFLQYFYDHSASKLFKPLQDIQTRSSMDVLSTQEANLYSHLVDILCFLLRQHLQRSKFYILSEGLSSRVAQLINCPEKHLKLMAIKYFRACVNLNDDFHNRQMIQHHLFKPLLEIIYKTMPRDNLLNSACLELFEHIRNDNVKPVIAHLAENYRDMLIAIDHVPVFHGILHRHELNINPQPSQNTEHMDSSFMTSEADTPNTHRVTINGGGTRWQGLKELDADEEAYFNGPDDDEDDELSEDPRLPNGASPLNKPPVDYPDDDEDDDEDEEMVDSDGEKYKSLPQQPASATSQTSPKTSSPADAKPAASSPTDSDTSTAPTSTPPARPPTLTIAEKRRREEDDDDEIAALAAASAKRRASSAADEPAWDLSGKDDPSADADADADADKAGQRTLRRKRAFGPESSAPPRQHRRISISLGSAGKKEAGEGGGGEGKS